MTRPAHLQDINKATKDLNRIEKKKGLSVVDEVDGITAKPVQAKETKKRKAVPTGEENSKSKFIILRLPQTQKPVRYHIFGLEIFLDLMQQTMRIDDGALQAYNLWKIKSLQVFLASKL